MVFSQAIKSEKIASRSGSNSRVCRALGYSRKHQMRRSQAVQKPAGGLVVDDLIPSREHHQRGMRDRVGHAVEFFVQYQTGFQE